MKQTGQTLIETILATFMLVTALVTGLSLAVYALSTSVTAQNQAVAANLAREGIEAVRMMRDSNWLAGDFGGGANGLQSCPAAPMNGKFCYPNVYVAPTYNFNNGVAGNFNLTYDTSTRTWTWVNDFFLFLQPNGSFSRNSTGEANWLYSRKIKLSFLTTGSYSAAHPALVVQSIVGWKGKNCTEMPAGTGDPESTNCKIIVEEHLTNWKDYN